MPPSDEVRVLHVDDDASFRNLACKVLEDLDPQLALESASSGREALEKLEEGGFDAIVCDYKLPDLDGLEILERVRKRRSQFPFILFTGRGDESVASEAISAGVTDYLSKDGKGDRFQVLANRVRNAVRARRDRRRLAERERELVRKERRYQAILEDPNILVGRLDTDGTLVDVNRTAMEYVDEEPEAVTGEAFWETPWWPDDEGARREVRSKLERALDGEYVDFEADLTRPDGEPYSVRGFFRPVRDEAGTVVSVIVSSRDITERRAREERLRRSERTLRRLYEITSDHDRAFDEKLEALLALGADRLDLPYGYLARLDAEGEVRTVEAAHGDHEALEPGERRPLASTFVHRVLDAGGFVALEDAVDAGLAGGGAGPAPDLETYAGAPVEVEGEAYGALCFAGPGPREEPFTDVEEVLVDLMAQWTGHALEREQTEQDLRAQNEHLDEFARLVSHDLRNPLNVASGQVELALRKRDSEHLEEAAAAHDRMASLIDDLLNLARQGASIEATQPVTLAGLAERCWGNVDTQDATLTVESSLVLRADPGRLAQLLENLFRNAVEHAGTAPRVTVGALDDGFYVEDDGPGVPPDERDEVLDSGFSTAEGGTGFGLSIVERIATAHGWRVTVTESEAGGARFEFTGVEPA